MNTIINGARFRRFAVSVTLLVLIGLPLWAGGKKDIETVTAEGGEIWQHDFDVSERKKGTYNYIVNARDRAGNEAVAGPRNVKVNPNAGLPTARIVYPANNAIIRETIDILGLSAGRYGISRVMLRLDNEDWGEVSGTEYWSRVFSFANVTDGKHSFSVQAFDSKNMPGPIERVDFMYDSSPPTLDLTSHKVGDIISGNVTFRGTASDPNGLRRLEYSTDGTTFRSLSGGSRGTSAKFSISMATKREADGPLVIYLRATDTTGISLTLPYLFFVDNQGPELELYTPMQDEDTYGNFVLSGRAYDSIGIERLRYEWGRVKNDIELRPGDPFWTVPLEMVRGSANSIKVIAVDKVGNTSSVSVKMADRRKIKVPTMVIDYPFAASLSALSPDEGIYGRINSDFSGHALLIDGIGEIEARNSFRIGPEMLPQGRVNLKMTPIAFDGTRGSSVTVRYTKLGTSQLPASSITVASPQKYSWQYGTTLTLSGAVNPAGARVEYRLSPQEGWRELYADSAGNFNENININDLPHGPVHMELRTAFGGMSNLSVYNPFNRARTQAEISFISPPARSGPVHGSKTIIGQINHEVPIRSIAYSLDRYNYQEIDYTFRHGKAWFNYFCNFNGLHSDDGQIFFRITDASGYVYEVEPEYVINPNPPLPTLIVNTPTDEEVFTHSFEISGVAFDEVGITGAYWRILGPRMDSVSPGPAGDIAREAAVAFERNPYVPFNRLLTDQSFQIPVDFSMITDGEYIVEIYVTNPYDVRSEIVSRTIKVSTAPPETRIISPTITRYNSHAILVRGYSNDANGIAEVTISMDNGVTWQDVILTEEGDWEIALNTVAYTDGIYAVLVNTVDKYGITTFSNAMVNIDNTLPELYISSPVNGQYVGTEMPISGRVSDNIQLKSVDCQIISAANPEFQRNYQISPQLVLFETVSLSGFPQGEYIIRVVAKDLADNESIVSRNIMYDAEDNAAQIAIFNPQDGESHTGPISVAGIVTGNFLPESVRILLDGRLLTLAYVDRYGVFRYEIPETSLTSESSYKVSVSYNSAETGRAVNSPVHTVYFKPFGPALIVNSHRDGDVITKRPWLSGRAWVAAPDTIDGRRTRQERAEMSVDRVEISYDNGRSFRRAKGHNDWKYRLETSLLPAGPQPIVIKARFGNGDEAIRRLLVVVDTTAPQVDAIAPLEKTVHRDNILVYGTASDNYTLADVNVSLRPYDKFFYSIPGPLQGMYFDVKAMGATYFDVGLGISLFKDNVRFQAQYGITPIDGLDETLIGGGRYTGDVIGIKLLANILYLPFDFLFGPDWAFYSMNVAIGANFSYFMMAEWQGTAPRTPLYMGAVLAQWDVANIDMQFFYPNWKYFRKFALYVEPELWFASSDVQEVEKEIFRITVGLRLNWF